MNTTPRHQLTEIRIPTPTVKSRNSTAPLLHHRLPRIAALAWLAVLPTLASAQDGTTEYVEPNAFEKLWSYATLYKDDMNPILQEFKLRGRYQGQYWDTDADQGSQSNWEDRRSRFGFDAKLYDKKVEARFDFQSNDQFNDFYDGLVDAYLRWKPKKWLSFTAGKNKPMIGQYDWLESTNSQPTFERSQIFNQLGINRAAGLTAEGTLDEISWRAGVYTNSTPATTADPVTKIASGKFGDGEFGDFTGGHSFSLGAGYDFKHLLNVVKADFRVDWLHSDRFKSDLVNNKYDDNVSSTFWVKEGYAAVVLEGFYATGGDYSASTKKSDGSDVYGFFIQPTYDIIPNKLQLVGRYSHSESEGSRGVVGQSRYEKKVATKSVLGDAYDSLYGGVQYFINGDKLKVLAGAEWARLQTNKGDSYDGVTYLSGIRFSF
jgi:hypothetical protein